MLYFKSIIFTTYCIFFTEATRSDGFSFKSHTKNVREALQKARTEATKMYPGLKKINQKGLK